MLSVVLSYVAPSGLDDCPALDEALHTGAGWSCSRSKVSVVAEDGGVGERFWPAIFWSATLVAGRYLVSLLP